VTTTETPTKPAEPGRGDKAVKPKKRRVLLFGDSHAHAVLRAIEKREGKGQPVPLSAHRLLKEKNGVRIGTTSFEAFLKLIADLGPKDIVVSMIGGNQHAVYSTIQHPQRFDFFSFDVDHLDPAAETIPYRAIEDIFSRGLRSGDGRSLEALRSGTAARVVHVLPPPPKSDNEYIAQHHETLFAKDLPQRGVSPPELRMKFWQLQKRVLMRICADLGIEVVTPPERALDEAGFLLPEFYAKDATHGNWLYGERILREIEAIYLGLKVNRASK
jgi:hypothetical protein